MACGCFSVSPPAMGFTGSAYTLCGRLAEGMPLLEQAVERTVAEGRKVHEALWVTRVGEAALLARRLEAAHTHAVQALTLARERQERGHQAYALLWSAKLSLPSPFRGCEVLELAVDLVQIKGLWIKFAPYPVHHLLMLGVLGVADGFQQTRIAPDAPTILGRAGAFPRETERVALPRLQRQDFFHEQLVLPAIPEIVFVHQLVLRPGHHLLQ